MEYKCWTSGDIDPGRHKYVVKTSYFWSQRCLRLIWNGSCNNLFLTCCQDAFQEMSKRHLPGDVLKTSSRRNPQDVFQETSSRPFLGDILKTSKTSSRLFLVKARTIWRLFMDFLSTYVLSYLDIPLHH